MPTPFPGRDPYLEDRGYWPDFHLRFISYCFDALADRLPEGYEARIDESVSLVEEPDELARVIKPDVAIERDGLSSRPNAGTIATLDPVVVPLLILDPHRQGYIKILHGPDRSLVAVVEVLSPTNKIGEGRGEYLAKRNALLNQPVHLVELDLLRRDRRLPARACLPEGDFYAMVSRAERRPDCEVYAWGIRDALPTIPVPLRLPDGDIALNLAEVFSIVYERGRYSRSVKYRNALAMPLRESDQAWAAERLLEKTSGS